MTLQEIIQLAKSNPNLHPFQAFARLQAGVNRFLKRAFDIFAASTALVLLSPFFGLIALAIRRDSPGPVFYRGDRTGLKGKPFKILKFRTMYETAASYSGPKVTAHDDERVTPVGRWLRDTKLNELPQFWNVLVGEMSLVGPRPEDPTIAKTWPQTVWKEVLSVRPGITSPATIQYHNEEALLSFGDVIHKYMQEISPDKMRLDQLYVRYHSLLLDLDVLLWTGLILIPHIRSYSPPENLIFVGPISRLMRRYLRWFWIDFMVTFASISLTGLVWRAFGPLDVGVARCAVLALSFALLFSLMGSLLGINRITWSKATYRDVFGLLPAWLMAMTIALLADLQLRVLPAGLIVVAANVALFGFITARYRSRLVTAGISQIIRFETRVRTFRERVLIIGSGRTAEQIAWMLAHPSYARKFRVVGFIVDDLMTVGMRMYGSKVIGTTDHIAKLVKKLDVGVIILADHRMGCREYESIASACKGMLTKVVVAPDIFGSLNGLAQPERCDRSSADPGPTSYDFRCQHCLVRYASNEKETSEIHS